MNTAYSFVLLTCDRSPRSNYLNATLFSLIGRSKIPTDSHLRIYQNGPIFSPDYQKVLSPCIIPERITITASTLDLPINHHVSEAIRFGINNLVNTDDWLIFLEDDLLFCADFFNSVRRWLDRNATNDRRLYSFGCPYPNATPSTEIWSYYPIESFYGTQCFAVRSIDAMTISDYLSSPAYLDKFLPGQYDLGIAYILSHYYPNIGYFSASRPSFVQHVGVESSIRPDGPYFTFPSFPGENWSYNP